MGQCPACKEWNTFAEADVRRTEPSKAIGLSQTSAYGAATGAGGGSGAGRIFASSGRALDAVPLSLSDIESEKEERLETGFREFSRVLGGGVVRGSLVLVGGDPGVGKSTLLLQTAADMAGRGSDVIYISGEESLRQIKLRADRIGNVSGGIRFLSETNIYTICDLIERDAPDICVIDSIQTMFSPDVQSIPGSVSQVRECAQRLMVCAKQCNTACFIVGHVTKEGTVAGPRVLEHIVDTVLYFESGDQFGYRILRGAKNRFGSTNEIGVFEMGSDGLKEVANPSEYLLEGRPLNATGAAVTCVIEGSRPLLMEVQGLVAETQYNIPRRQTNGMDYNRLAMLLAVLSKRCGISFYNIDAYVNIAGGMRITQPSADLAVVAALISSMSNSVIPADTVIIGEVGLSGEVRLVPQASERIKEAAKLGFKRVIIPRTNMKSLESFEDISLMPVGYVSELVDILRT